MKNRNFYVKAIWDEEAQVFVSDSDIVGLHIEAETLEDFQREMHAHAFDLVVANHIKPKDMVQNKLSDLIPTIFWEAPDCNPTVAA
jgi:hypothetical protein